MAYDYQKTPVGESKLIKGLKERHPSALSDFYDIYAPALYGAIKKGLANEEAANRILLNTFRVITSSIEKHDFSKERLFSWASKIARQEISKEKVELAMRQLFLCRQSDFQ